MGNMWTIKKRCQPKVCERCKAEFIPVRDSQVFCSVKCQRRKPIEVLEKTCVVCDGVFKTAVRWHRYCSVKCRDKQRLNARTRLDGKSPESSTTTPFGEKICPVCKGRFSSTRWTKKYCSFRCSQLKRAGRWTNKHRESGLCRACSERPIPGSVSWCKKHWLMQAAARAGLRGFAVWEKIGTLLENQNYTCPYSGRKLVIGENASLDHVNPRSTHPLQIGSIENIEWVDVEVNRAKRTMTRDEFIALCTVIADRAKNKTAPDFSGAARST